MEDWNDSIKGQRQNIVDALIRGDVHDITFEALALQSLLNLYYQREFISCEFFSEHYDFTERVLRAVKL